MPASIGTHDGKFHADEALACYMLRALPEYRDAAIVRTRDASLLAECTVVVDVGGVYDHAARRYDHHQRDFTHTMRSLAALPHDTKLSSAGLVYAHYGRQVIKCLNADVKDEDVDVFYAKIYQCLIEEFDGIDNGVEPFDGKPRYETSTGIAHRVSRLMPHWNEPSTREEVDKRFESAVALAGAELADRLDYYARRWLPARDAVRNAFDGREGVHPSGRIMSFDDGGLPWKEHLFRLEKERDVEGRVLFALYPDDNGCWRVQTVPPDGLHPFDMRLPLCESWRGLRDEALSAECGVAGGVFVHAAGFIGGNRTRHGALDMADKCMRAAGVEADGGR